MLTLVGLLTAAGALVLSTHLAPVSIWTMNFAVMFALALGMARVAPLVAWAAGELQQVQLLGAAARETELATAGDKPAHGRSSIEPDSRARTFGTVRPYPRPRHL